MTKQHLTAGLMLAALAFFSACRGGATTEEKGMDPLLMHQGKGGVDEVAMNPGSYRKHTSRDMGSDTHPEVRTDVTGTWLYFSTDREGTGYNVARKLLSGAALENVTSAKGDELWPRVSPSGRYLAYGGNAAGNWDIYVQDLFRRENAPVRVTQSASHDIHPTWSPDGRTLVYASESSTEGDFILQYIELMMPGEGGMGDAVPMGDATSPRASQAEPAPMLIGNGGGFAELPGKGKSGGDEGPHTGSVRVIERGTLMTAQGSVVTGLNPDFRPGNEYRHQLVYQDSRKSGDRWHGLKTFDLGTGVVRLMPVSDGFGAIQPRWSPSGEQIVFATVGKQTQGMKDAAKDPVGAMGFAVTTPDGETVRDIGNPTVNETVSSPSWVRIGTESRLYFAAMENGGKAEFIASVRLDDR